MSSDPSLAPAPGATPRWRKLLLPAAVVAIASAAVGVFVWRAAGPDQDRAEALKLAHTGNFAPAEPRLKAAIQRNPADAEVAEALARGYVKQDAADAGPALDRWIELRPDDKDARRMRFEAHRKAKDIAKAYPDGRKLLELDPSDAQLRRTLVGQAFSLGKFEEAEPLCRAALQAQPNDRALRSLLAEIRRARGDLADAGAILDQLLKDFPGNPPALLARGILHLDLGQPEKAAPLLREVVRTDPTRQRTAGYHLALALERCGEVEEAKRVSSEVRRLQAVATAEEAIKNQPDSLELRTLQGEMLLAEGHAKDGVRFLESVLAENASYAPAHRALARHYEQTGQPDKAADHRRRAGP